MAQTRKQILLSTMVAVAFLAIGGLVLAKANGLLGTLAGADETPVTAITVSAVDESTRTITVSTIEVNNGTIRMVATITPPSATDTTIVWSVVDGTGTASIDRCGQLFAITNGTVTVTATSASYPSIFGTEIITISNQLEGIDLKTAANYTILAETGISSLGSSIQGDIGANAANSVTGFGTLTLDAGGEFSTSPQVSGRVYLPNYTAPTPATLTAAVGDMGTAYTTGGLATPPTSTELYAGDLSGQTIVGGIYKWSTSVAINSDVTLSGDASDVWIFQIAGGITQKESTKVILSGGARAENVFWLSATTVALGTNANFEGIVLAKTDITVGANTSVNGRLLAQTRVDLGAGCVVDYPS
jgi:hypothetical protein